MADQPDVQVWATAISTNAYNGRKIIFRYAKDLAPDFDRSSKPVRVILVWRYESETGQPKSQEHQSMNLLEDSLEPVLYQENFATLALVSTGENLREWTYYSKSDIEFMTRLNLALSGMPAFPIDIHTAYDPAWSMYEEFKAGVKEKSE